jgi:hypothetical protein
VFWATTTTMTPPLIANASGRFLGSFLGDNSYPPLTSHVSRGSGVLFWMTMANPTPSLALNMRVLVFFSGKQQPYPPPPSLQT